MRFEDPTYDLIIVGGGPAGCAAAIQAVKLMPELRRRILLLDKAHFPRVKLCGGGVVKRADRLLQRMEISCDVQVTAIHSAVFLFPGRSLTLKRANLFRIVRRVEFDHALLQHVKSMGVHVQEDATVTRLVHVHEALLVHTPRGTYRARVVIGADGANGIARRTVVPSPPPVSMVGLETFTDPVPSELGHDTRHTAVFDFTCTSAGVQGYCWDFPTGSEARPLVNRGVFHSHLGGPSSRLNLKSYLADSFLRRGIAVDASQIRGHPEHRYDPSLPCSAPRLVLAGDAIGVEPLLGEGISSALETGMLAAEAACRALVTGDYAFTEYGARIRNSGRARTIVFKGRAARYFYAGHTTPPVLTAALGLSAAYGALSHVWEALASPRGTTAPSPSSLHVR